MDKCILKVGDRDKLFEWRDRNKELVRRSPMPVKGIEIFCEDENVKLKCVRKGNELEIRIYYLFDKTLPTVLVVSEYKPLQNGYAIRRIRPDYVDKGVAQEALSIYCSLMALMTYGDDIEYTEPELDVLDSVVVNQHNTEKFNRSVHTHTTKSQQPSITYLLNRESSGRLSVRGKGHHASPKGEFRVRGHFRHYANGNVVWVAEYKKGTGKRKDKVYKL